MNKPKLCCQIHPYRRCIGHPDGIGCGKVYCEKCWGIGRKFGSQDPYYCNECIKEGMHG